MKLFTICTFVLFALSSSVGLASDINLTELLPSAILVKNVDLRTWPESVSLAKALEIFKAMGASDPETTAVFTRAKQKLSEHGVSDIVDISSYCHNDASLGDAYFSQETKILDTRIAVAGTVLKDWSATSAEIAKKSYASKLLKTAFVEYLLVAEQPNICIKKSNNLLFSYNAFVHELFHFLGKDTFKLLEDGITASSIPNFLDSMVSETGGEFEAYKVGLSAEIKFFIRNNINITKDLYRFFNEKGELTDAKSFKDAITTLYAPYYNDPANSAEITQGRVKMAEWQLQILNTNIRPVVSAKGDKALQKIFSDELARVTAQLALLKK